MKNLLFAFLMSTDFAATDWAPTLGPALGYPTNPNIAGQDATTLTHDMSWATGAQQSGSPGMPLDQASYPAMPPFGSSAVWQRRVDPSTTSNTTGAAGLRPTRGSTLIETQMGSEAIAIAGQYQVGPDLYDNPVRMAAGTVTMSFNADAHRIELKNGSALLGFIDVNVHSGKQMN